MTNLFKHIVLADDDTEDIELYKSIMTELCDDLTLTIALDGDQLMLQLQHIITPDLILLNVQMRKKTGIDCLKSIRANSEWNNVPILAITVSQHEKEFYLSMGANYSGQKPISYYELKSFIQDICDGNLA